MTTAHLLNHILNAFRRRKASLPKAADLVLGVSSVRNAREPFVILPERLRTQHLGIVGLSGSGKTYFIEHLIRQDIRNKNGFVVFDVHGDLADTIVSHLAERATADPDVHERTIIIEPFDPKRSFGFNPLERSSETSAFLQAEEFAQMLKKRWFGERLSPRTEELLRNSLYTLSANDGTLLSFPDLLSDERMRQGLVAGLSDGPVKAYWLSRYNRLSFKMQAVFREPLLSRISSFLGDPLIRDIVGQSHSTFSFGKAIQKGQWIIINLSKGRLGEENANLLGSLLFTKLELSIMALASVPESKRRLFAVYADELQNLAGDTFGRLIAEARKYKIALVTGHQYWKQLDPALRQAMLAVGSKAYFRLHYHDAVELAGELSPTQKKKYLMYLTKLGRGEVLVRLGAGRPILLMVPAHRKANPTAEELDELRSRSAARYTKNRQDLSRDRQALPKSLAHNKRGNQALIGT